MKVKLSFLAMLTILALVSFMSIQALAGSAIPKTAINTILDYKNSLRLTNDQVGKLEKYNNQIIDKMMQTKAQVDIRKVEIDKLTSDWSQIHGIATSSLIDEYYDYLAKAKQLELESIMRAKAILTREQMHQYTELASIESMMLKLDSEYMASY